MYGCSSVQNGLNSAVVFSGHNFCLGPTSFPGCPASLPATPRPSPISLSLRAEEELGLGALCVVQQEESEEVFVRSM